MNLRHLNIREVRRVINNEKKANQLLADSWLLLDSDVVNGEVWYVLAKPEKLSDEFQLPDVQIPHQ